MCPIKQRPTRLPQCFVLWSSEPSDESVGSQSQKSAGLIPLLLGIRWGSASIGMNRGNRMRHLALQLPFLWWWCGSGTCSPALSLQPLGKRGWLKVGGACAWTTSSSEKRQLKCKSIRFPLLMPIEAEPHRIPTLSLQQLGKRGYLEVGGWGFGGWENCLSQHE